MTDAMLPLVDGPAVPLVAVRLILELEDAGGSLRLDDAGDLRVQRAENVSPDLLARMRAHKAALREIVKYITRREAAA